eukprot:GHVR01166283.1.p1 GENE.GHVR01166283.1~~GHVR01166283.1.p1  ORF type:complete len:121 (+),score=18.41 GHVR01166283.1:722-1084(+)
MNDFMIQRLKSKGCFTEDEAWQLHHFSTHQKQFLTDKYKKINHVVDIYRGDFNEATSHLPITRMDRLIKEEDLDIHTNNTYNESLTMTYNKIVYNTDVKVLQKKNTKRKLKKKKIQKIIL